jgi:hypothetical protein
MKLDVVSHVGQLGVICFEKSGAKIESTKPAHMKLS